MKISSPKPHFFKPILSGFKNGLKIPTSFSNYILGTAERYPDEALLKNKGKEWRVNVVNEHFVGDGWSRFAEENNLELGDFVVVQHQGSMAFDVIIFDGITQCKKEHHTCGELRPSKKSRSEVSTSKEVKKKTPSDHGEKEEVPHFIATIHRSNWLYYLSVPRLFARSFGLAVRKRKIIVKDEQKRSWYFDLRTSADGQIRIRRGSNSTLAEFFTANGFKKGDSYKFEVAVAGNRQETPVIRILPLITMKKMAGNGVELIYISESASENNGHPAYSTTSTIKTMKKTNRQDKGKGVEVIEICESESEYISESNDCPHFTCTIKRYSSDYGYLNIQMRFARLNGLCGKREMVLMDNRGRRWRVNLRSDCCHLRIRGGWTKFRDENGIKEGDAFRFEIVENGVVPVARLTVMD